ncbi:MAG: MFS transporter [Vampirovibrionia bacterium]
MKPNKLILLLSSPIALLTIGHMAVDLYAGFIIPILPFIAKKLDISLPLAGLIISFTGLTSSFLQPIYGYFSDRISKRFFVVWGLIIASIFISLTGIANSYLLLVIVIITANIGVGLYHPQATAYTGKLKQNSSNVNMGIFVAGGIVGYALGPMLSSSIVYFLGLKWTLLAAIPGLFSAFMVYKFLPKITFEKQKSNLKEIFSNINKVKHALLVIISIVIIRSFILMSMSTYFPFEWEDNLGYSVLTVGIVMTIFSFAGGISSISGGIIANKIGARNALLISFLVPLPILLSALYFMKTSGILSFALYIIGGAVLESTISINILLAQKILPQHIGIASGITGGFCWGIAGFLMFPLGILIDMHNMYIILNCILFLPLLATMLVLLVPKEVFKTT